MTPSGQIVPYGFCHCGCGKKTSIAKQSDTKRGHINGQPKKFVHGHNGVIWRDSRELGHFKIEGVYCRLISLTQGQWAIVDESDFEWLMQWKWFARRCYKRRCFYAEREIRKCKRKQKAVPMHRQILGLSDEDPRFGDHKDPLRTTENRRKNLRPADEVQSSQNRGLNRNNTSGYKGVCWVTDRQMWLAYIWVNRKMIRLGYFKEKTEAAAVRLEAARKYHGEFARVA